ncbi:hypothetical protein SAM40697_1692 [Streptomyces ambofaciens]|uniref:Secreted protein n=1 Tax=Streptomyces ambofaciens TaxID=1889 RepID=A0ABM6AWE5_STRAM|nr:hypothetical protein [Streptomyces ambofaciens]ANB05652.1 hypothetical protein SAM40697_1692 [Streptomyces ambofaciens]
MSAPSPARPPQVNRGGVEVRLPWWALALPVLAFVVLLLMILNPVDAHAAAAGEPATAHLLERLRELTAR